ncbi:nucleotide exchange factor GrpE [Patescibacteria group bacterium]
MTDQKKKHTDASELDKSKKQAEEYLNGWKRAKADYLNQKKEFEKREKETIQFANAALIAELLPIYSNLKLALNHKPEDKTGDWAKGIGQIYEQWKKFFLQIGIKEIETIGKKFDPAFHEAVTKEKKEGEESGIIFEEVGAGYTLHDKTLQPAKVKVVE